MNPYTSLLAKAVDSACGDTRAARETIYRQAREALTAHLSRHEGATREAIEAETVRLDEAIATIESVIGQSLDDKQGRQPGEEPPGDRLDVVASPDATDAAGPAPSRRRQATDRITRLIPPLRIGGMVLRVVGIMSNPYFLMGSLLAGLYIGLYSKGLAAVLAPVADLYVELLKMVLIPFMVSAIVVSFSRLFGGEMTKRHLGPIFAVFFAGLALVALFGVGISVGAAPGSNITGTMKQTLGQVINHSAYAVDLEVALNSPPPVDAMQPGSSLLDHIIPDNIFRALTAGDNLKILFFAIAFGVGLGSLQSSRGDGLRIALLSIYDVCTQLIAWVNMLLPVALCGMVAKQVATVGPTELVAMLRFTIGFGLVATLVCLLSVALIAWASASGFVGALRAVREPLLLAMATRSSVTCIPAAMTSLTDKLGYDRGRVELLLPLGITLFRFGPVLYYAFTTVFVAQLYNIVVSPAGYLLIVAGAILTGLASAGTTGVLTISLLGVIFQPLGLPLEAALALLVTVDPLIDMARTACIVLPNCAAVAVVYRGDDNAGRRAAAGELRAASSLP